MKTMTRSVPLFLVLACATVAYAAPRTYTIASDGKNSAEFRIDNAIETIVGTTTKISGTLVADPDDVAASTVDIRVELASLDSDSA